MTVWKIYKWILLFEIKFPDHRNHIFKKFLNFSEVDISWEIMMIVNEKDRNFHHRVLCKSLSTFFHLTEEEKYISYYTV